MMVEKLIEWNVVVADSTDTPVYRQINEDFLRYLFDSHAINVEMLLENSSIPFSQKLLAQLRSAQDQMEAGQGAQAAQQLTAATKELPESTPAAQNALALAAMAPEVKTFS